MFDSSFAFFLICVNEVLLLIGIALLILIPVLMIVPENIRLARIVCDRFTAFKNDRKTYKPSAIPRAR
jgi:uncharacterized membrane protein